jgi:hypothetical protein
MYKGLALVALLAAALGGWWYFNILPASQDSTIVVPNSATSTKPVSQWQWQFDPAGEDPATGIPKTNVTLRNGSTSYSIGATEGNCFDVAQSDWKLLTEEGELAGAICWWAGGGTEIGVFSDDGRAIVKIGDVDEGTAEGGGTRGNFRTLFAIDFGYIPRINVIERIVTFDDARWLSGAAGEDAAIAAGLCTEETRADCLPNDFYIYNALKNEVSIPAADTITVYMLTWNAGEAGIKRQFIKFDDFAQLVNDPEAHWRNLPYNITVKNNEVIMIEEVYVP